MMADLFELTHLAHQSRKFSSFFAGQLYFLPESDLALVLNNIMRDHRIGASEYSMPPMKLKSKAAGAKTHPKVYDLCYDQLELSHEVLVCEGGCNSSVHHYCAGVTRYHYEKLTAGAEPFVRMFCSLKTHRAWSHSYSWRLRISRPN